MKEQMAHRLGTPEGKALYKQRKQTVEPVFGAIKEVLGFRRFSMRGKEKAETEWSLVCLIYNLKKMFKLSQGCAPKRPAAAAKQHALAFSARIRGLMATHSCMIKYYNMRLAIPLPLWRLPEVSSPTGC